jgi:hypothetical protein
MPARHHRSSGRVLVRPQDRFIDIMAVLILVGGIALFALGRTSLTALANNTHPAPPEGVTWVSVAEKHDARTRMGIGMALAGLVLSLGAAMKHASARRRQL